MASFPIPSDPVQKEKIMTAVRDVSGQLGLIAAARDVIKETIEKISKEHEIPKKLLTQFAKAYHNSSFAKVVGTNEEFEELTLALQPKSIVDDFETQNGNLEHGE